MASLLADDGPLQHLREQAARRTWKTWDVYAEETWRHLVE